MCRCNAQLQCRKGSRHLSPICIWFGLLIFSCPATWMRGKRVHHQRIHYPAQVWTEI